MTYKRALYGFTDYPIAELGDQPGLPAPVRPVKVIGYDRDKYCRVMIHGSDVVTSIKSGYIYATRRAYDEGKCRFGGDFSYRQLCSIPV